MINLVLYYSFISDFVCTESIPQNKLKVRSVLLFPYRAEFSTIISHKTYNMDNYFTEICVSLRRYFICLTYLLHILRLSPFSVQLYIISLTEKVFNQKSQGYKLTKFYNKNKIIIIYNNVKENTCNCKLFIISYVNEFI